VRPSREEHHRGAGPRDGMKNEDMRGESRAIKMSPLFFTTQTSLISPVGASMVVTPSPYNTTSFSFFFDELLLNNNQGQIYLSR